MVPSSRSSFKTLILENLGAPVVRVNVTDSQIENQIDRALYLWQEYHYDATERAFVPIQVTEQDKTNKYISVPEEVIGVYRVVHLGDVRGFTQNLLSSYHQIRVQLVDLFNTFNHSIVPYHMAMTHITMLDQILAPQPLMEFNRHVDKIYLQMNWERISSGEYIVVDGRKAINSSQMWGDRWLQDYATALVKLQWGQNLSKWTGAQMPGGITINGMEMKAEAKEEIEVLEQRLKKDLAEPLGIFIG